MSQIDDLIAKFCPDGVRSYPLWKLTIWDKKFNAVERHKQSETRRYKYFLAGEIKGLSVESGGTVKLLSTGAEDYGWTTPEIAGDAVSDAEIVAIPWGGTPSVQYYKGLFLTTDNRIAIVKDSQFLSTRYLYYSLLIRIKVITSFYRGAGIQHPNMAKVLDLKIPVPPLEVQSEIVKILDAFTELEAELVAELEARRQQYAFYRNKLLSFEEIP